MMCCFCLLAISVILLCTYTLYCLGKVELMKMIMKKKMMIEVGLICIIFGGQISLVIMKICLMLIWMRVVVGLDPPHKMVALQM
jgi:hypothetical protein